MFNLYGVAPEGGALGHRCGRKEDQYHKECGRSGEENRRS